MKELEDFIKEMQRIEQSIKFEMSDIPYFRIELNGFKDKFFTEIKELREEIKSLKEEFKKFKK